MLYKLILIGVRLLPFTIHRTSPISEIGLHTMMDCVGNLADVITLRYTVQLHSQLLWNLYASVQWFVVWPHFSILNHLDESDYWRWDVSDNWQGSVRDRVAVEIFLVNLLVGKRVLEVSRECFSEVWYTQPRTWSTAYENFCSCKFHGINFVFFFSNSTRRSDFRMNGWLWRQTR